MKSIKEIMLSSVIGLSLLAGSIQIADAYTVYNGLTPEILAQRQAIENSKKPVTVKSTKKNTVPSNTKVLIMSDKYVSVYRITNGDTTCFFTETKKTGSRKMLNCK